MADVADMKIYRLTGFIFVRWMLLSPVFVLLFTLVVPIVEFPIMLLVAIVSRILGYPDFAGSLHEIIYGLIYQPKFLGVVFLVVSFFVLRAVLRMAIGKDFGGQILILQDAPKPAQ